MSQIGIGQKIRAVRRDKHMTQRKLAELIGCKSSFVSHIESNSRNLSLAYLQRIAAALKTPAYRLMTSEDDAIAQCVDTLNELSPEHFKMAKDYLEYLVNRQGQEQQA